jgi:hypothetical protein
MPPNVRTLRYTQRELRFSGGLNTQAPPTEIADNELTVCSNYYFSSNGDLIKRPGFFKFNPSAIGTSPLSVIGFDYVNTSFVLSGSGPFSWVYGATTATAITGAGVTSIYWVQYINGVMYAGTNVGIHRFLTATTLGAVLANSNPTSCGVFHKSRLWAAGFAINPSRLYFSDPNAPDTWQVASSIDVGVDDSDRITALISMGDLLFIFKQHSVWTLYVQGVTPADWVLRRVVNNLGTPRSFYGGNTSVVTWNNEIYFMSDQGLIKTNGSSFTNLSNKIWDQGNVIYSNITVGSSAWRLTRWNNSLIMLASTVNGGYCYVYNLITGAWSSWGFFGGASGPFDDFYVQLPYEGFATQSLIAIVGTTIYGTPESYTTKAGYNTGIGVGVNSFADGFQWGSPGTGSGYFSSFRSKEIASFIDWYWRVKWASLEYLAYASPQFNSIGDGSIQAAYFPGFNSSLRKAYKIPGPGRCRLFQLKCDHTATSPFEFYRGEFHFTIKTHISASGTP